MPLGLYGNFVADQSGQIDVQITLGNSFRKSRDLISKAILDISETQVARVRPIRIRLWHVLKRVVNKRGNLRSASDLYNPCRS